MHLGARALNSQRSLGFVPSIQLSIIATLGVNDFFSPAPQRGILFEDKIKQTTLLLS